MVPIILDYSGSCNSTLHAADPKLYWICALNHLASSNWHPMGTCRLGDVVDDQLLVHGFDNLRITDASVIPVLSGHPNAAVAMLAEYLSQIVVTQYNAASTLSRAAFTLVLIGFVRLVHEVL